MRTLAEKDMIGIGAFTIRTKERLCALRPKGGVLIVDTLLYPDKIKVDLSSKAPATKLTNQELKMADSLVEMMAQPFNPENFKDHYREALEKLIDAKLEGLPAEQLAQPKHAVASETDLMDSLRRSLGVIEGGKKGKETKRSESSVASKSKSRSGTQLKGRQSSRARESKKTTGTKQIGKRKKAS